MGRDDLSGSRQEAVLREHGVTTHHCTMPREYQLVLDSGGSAELHLSATNPEALNTYLRMRTLALYASRWPELDADAADVFGVCCVLHYTGRSAGSLWQEAQVAALSSRPRVWTGRSLRDLLDCAEPVMEEVDPVENVEDWARQARTALLAARGYRDDGEYVLASIAYEDSAQCAVRILDWGGACDALLGAADAQSRRGNHRKARRLLFRTLNIAKRQGLRDAVAMALHDLFTVAVDTGQTVRARELVTQVYEAYGPDHPNLPRFAHDLGELLLAEGRFAAALPLAMETVHHAPGNRERIAGWGSVARAAGGAGNPTVFDDAVLEIERALAESTCGGNVAQGLLDVARGGAMLGRRAVALSYGRKALEVAVLRGEMRVRFEAEAFVESAGREEYAARHSKPRSPAQRYTLAERLVDALRHKRGLVPA